MKNILKPVLNDIVLVMIILIAVFLFARGLFLNVEVWGSVAFLDLILFSLILLIGWYRNFIDTHITDEKLRAELWLSPKAYRTKIRKNRMFWIIIAVTTTILIYDLLDEFIFTNTAGTPNRYF